jgi:CDGSH-type Zn-finger protein/uncharacterized Fe-S cluster protein YjdI
VSEKRHTFENATVTVTWSKARCIHAAACVAGLPGVFRPGERPWIRLEGTDAEAVARIVMRCPTGALQFTRRDGGPAEEPAAANIVLVSRDGPLYLRGDIEMRDEAGALALRDTRMALCRCGRSANKPFCDNAHVAAGFRDPGTVNDPDAVQDAGPGPAGDRLAVQPQADGPLHLQGPLVLAGGDGATTLEGTSAWLCRCGHSGTKPFCDGSHTAAGFRSGRAKA